MTEEEKRIEAAKGDPDGWRLWGPYLSERAWGTVREDYSTWGDAWNFFSHDHARSRVYRWNEDGLGGISDIRQNLCFALALWNGHDPILKERLFGLTGPQGNHGEDVKEYYFHLDATPTHSYLNFLYKYPQAAFPYHELVAQNARLSRREWEFELLDTGVFEDNRYFDVFVEYAKQDADDIAIRITAHNRGPEDAPLFLLPTLWFRNTWAWGYDDRKPGIWQADAQPHGMRQMIAEHRRLGTYHLYAEASDFTGDAGTPQLLFTENETNYQKLYDSPNSSRFVKDGINDAVVQGNLAAVNPDRTGTKAAAVYRCMVPAKRSVTVRLRLKRMAGYKTSLTSVDLFGNNFEQLFKTRISEADAFYKRLIPEGLSDDARSVQRQAYAGLIWNKQYYAYDVEKWLNGDPAQPTPPEERKRGRNSEWKHVSASDVLSMPDKWEYPWFAAWDLAFHMIPFAQIDPDFAKHQLILMCREWYMHPNGQLPAYEWSFSDVNPPVHAWAALRLYKIERKMRGKGRHEAGDVDFLERIFHKLLLNFTWWVNRKDQQGNNVFEGGFLGLDNIGVFDRSAPLPTGGFIEQADGTAWMAMYCLNLLAIALELARVDRTYEDVATKFAEHFIYIAHALNDIGENHTSLWDEEDGFYYDVLHLPPSSEEDQKDCFKHLRTRSIAGLVPLFAVEAFDGETLAGIPDFTRRMDWFLSHKPHLCKDVANIARRGKHERALFSLVGPDRLRRVLSRVLDETEFLSTYGVRSLSRYHAENPFVLETEGAAFQVDYDPAESTSGMFGGNSNWRGPIWLPLNYLLIEALQKYDYVYGEEFKIEMPTGSGNWCTLWEVSQELSRRLTRLFLRDENARRPVYGGTELFQTDPHWRDHILFYEYFHGDNGAGLGASHQTGWTALVAKLISQSGE